VLDTHKHDIHEARQRDEDSFSKILSETARNDEMILTALRTGSQGNKERYTLSGLGQAFVKLASDLPSTRLVSEHEFIHKAANVLRRLSKQPVAVETPPSWQLNVLEVTYDTDGASLLGRGGLGHVYRGEWNGLAVAVKVMDVNLAQVADQIFQHEVKAW